MDVEQREPPAMRASDRERDHVLVRLHDAYAEGRLSEAELDERMDLVLQATTRPELAKLVEDLPNESATSGGATSPAPLESRAAGRVQVAYKNRVRRGGRWRVPERYTTAIYKGGCLLDLRQAELDGAVTTIVALAYKSTIEIVVPSNVRVEIGGFGVSSEVYGDPADGAPLIHVKGFAYKGAIEARTA